METLKILHEENERVWERYVLAGERIAAFRKEGSLGGALKDYFATLAGFITQLTNVVVRVFDGSLYEMEQKELQELNHALYADLLPENYDHCYGNPTYAVGQLGEEYGQVLSVVYSEIHSLTACAFEGRLCGLTCGMELLIELYNCFEVEGGYTGREIKEALYYYLHDYQEEFRRVSVQQKYDPVWGFAREIIMGAKLTDLRYLYFYGEYISENELKLAEYINSLPEETVSRMAFTYTDGYIRGFQTMGVDFSAKSVVNIRFAIGFERMIKKAVSIFEGMGKKVTIHRAAMNLAVRNYGYKDGFFATSVNPQYEYDHKNDMALCYDRKMQKTAVAAAKVVFDDYRGQCAAYAGPAALEVFGQEDFFPVNKKEAVQKDARATECMLEGSRELGLLMTDYIKSEETSYTIIAFPLPSIGEEFEEIFLETIRLNTLDNGLYQRMQQVLIDVLDTGERVLVRGGNGNRTNMVVCLHQLTDPASQTNFENCTADVNIPVGEVFTSPVLTGTNGVLHVGRVFLNGLEYRELEFTFVDGMVTDYKCANFEDPAENRRYIFDNILYGHETLPIGEFAIGTNRIAYEMGRKYGIQPKLPILIAEKTGPHFALGDTCYKRSEDHAVFNPDGKEIIARDNEISLLRRTDPAKAYMNCHTDITLPYDGLAEISVLQSDGTKVVLLKDGEFVLAGAKGLNVRE